MTVYNLELCNDKSSVFFWKFSTMKRIQTASKGRSKRAKGETFYFLFCTFFCLVLPFLSGCGNKFFDPTQVGRFRPVPAVNVILDSLGVAEEEPVAWEGAEDPRPTDVTAIEGDYVFRSGDTVRISIFELYREGLIVEDIYVVTETGKISIPDVGVVDAAGLTETQLEEEIRQILSPSILKDPSVVVTLAASQQRTFSILGNGVPRPGRYVIPRYDFRLTDALATAGGPAQFNVSFIYVSRYEGREPVAAPIGTGFRELEFIGPGLTEPEVLEPEESEQLIEPERGMLEIIAPRAQRYQWPESKVVIASSEMVTAKELGKLAWPEGFNRLTPGRRVWPNGRDVRKPSTEPAVPETTAERKNIEEVLKSLTESAGPPAVEKPTELDDILKTLSERSRREPVSERIDVEDILKSLAEPTAPEPIEELIKPEDVDVRKLFAEPADRDRMELPEKPGVVDVLKSLAEPGVPETVEEPIEEEVGRIEWIFQDGKWIPIQIGQPKPSVPVIRIEPQLPPIGPPVEPVVPGFEWAEAAKTRVIKIPADKLLAGDPRYNVVIKAGDSIHVPVDIIGECCIMGNVNRQGYINVTGRPMTLKMAIAAAGGLGPMAWPKRCEVIRRVGRDKEEIVMVDLDKIASGEQPDFFIKPNDLINVGTHPTSIWRAVLRNSFRATYGFGFIYDRNFADRDFGTSRPFSWF